MAMSPAFKIQKLQTEVDKLRQRSLDLTEELKAGHNLLKKGTGDVTAETTNLQMQIAGEYRAKTDNDLIDKEFRLERQLMIQQVYQVKLLWTGVKTLKQKISNQLSIF